MAPHFSGTNYIYIQIYIYTYVYIHTHALALPCELCELWAKAQRRPTRTMRHFTEERSESADRKGPPAIWVIV